MARVLPESHAENNEKLESKAYVDLFEARLRSGGIIRCTLEEDVNWNGYLWESLPIELSGDEENADGESARPTLTLGKMQKNELAQYVREGQLERADFIRYRVMREHIQNGTVVFQRRNWVLWRVLSITNFAITMELREILDGQNFNVPARMYIPPEFDFVTLG